MFASMLGIIPYSGVELMVYSYLTVCQGILLMKLKRNWLLIL